MKKKTIPVLSAVMTISFIILVALQFYFFREILKKSEKDFSDKVNYALEDTSKKLNENELKKYYKLFGNFYNEATQNKNVTTRQVIHSVIDSGEYRYIEFKNYIIENKNIPIPLTVGDTLQNTKIYKDEGSVMIKKDSNDHEIPKELSSQIEKSIETGEFSLQNFARLNFNQKPINQRVTNSQIMEILRKELDRRGIDSNFEISILNSQFQPTEVSSEKYEIDPEKNYQTVLFTDSDDQPQYYLSIYFPSKNVSVFKPYLWPIAITLLASIIVILIYGTSIYFMNRQKKISEIKTDFINNMTHEFKTPIATISIATSALKNKNVNSDSEKIEYYANLIKGENERMNKQVERILQMSKLENNQLHLKQDSLYIDHIVENAVNSSRLAVEDNNGIIIEDLRSSDIQVVGDAFHLTNSIINLIDNANKYSPENPEITVRSFPENDKVYITVSDKGIGIQPANISKLFEKFYREETGDIHNVKGHGLGLTYVREIIEKHGGTIGVESKPNEGSIFTVELPIKV